VPSIWIDTSTGTWGGPVEALRIVTFATTDTLKEAGELLYNATDDEICEFGIENGKEITLNN